MIQVNAGRRLKLLTAGLADIKVKALKTHEECYDAIDSIRRDYKNVVGGLKAWYSGGKTELTPAAKKKIDAINLHRKTLPYEGDDE